MFAVSNLGVIGIVIALLMGIVGGFPSANVNTTSPSGEARDETSVLNAFNELFDGFTRDNDVNTTSPSGEADDETSVLSAVFEIFDAFAGDNNVNTTSPSSEAEDETFSLSAVNEIFDGFTTSYNSIIDDVMSYQTDPDPRRAEAARQEAVENGINVMGKYKKLSEKLQAEFDRLTPHLGDLPTNSP